MSDTVKVCILWVAAVAAIIVFAIVIHGCGGSKQKDPDVPKLLSCAEKVIKIMNETPDCREIPQRIGELLDAQAECFEALTGEKAPAYVCGDGGV